MKPFLSVGAVATALLGKTLAGARPMNIFEQTIDAELAR